MVNDSEAASYVARFGTVGQQPSNRIEDEDFGTRNMRLESKHMNAHETGWRQEVPDLNIMS